MDFTACRQQLFGKDSVVCARVEAGPSSRALLCVLQTLLLYVLTV